MKILSHLNRAALIVAGTAVIIAVSANAADQPPGKVALLLANAGVTVVGTPSPSDPAVLNAKAVGPVQTSALGNFVENADIQARFPADPANPVTIKGNLTLTSLDGANSLKLTVSGAALPDPAAPYFYNAKYQITITGGTGVYAAAKGLAEATELVMFTSPLTATATWNMKGLIFTP